MLIAQPFCRATLSVNTNIANSGKSAQNTHFTLFLFLPVIIRQSHFLNVVSKLPALVILVLNEKIYTWAFGDEIPCKGPET